MKTIGSSRDRDSRVEAAGAAMEVSSRDRMGRRAGKGSGQAWKILGAAMLSMLSAFSAAQAQPPMAEMVGRAILGERPLAAAGQSATQLADGRWLLAGGYAAAAQLRVLDSASGDSTILPASLNQPRSAHSATLLPDGSVLIFGGVSSAGLVLDTAERFDPASGSVSLLGSIGLLPRTAHTASVLSDGRVLFAGGTDAVGRPLLDLELYDPASGRIERLNTRLDGARIRQLAALLPNSSVLLWGGLDARGKARADGDVYDAAARRLSPVSPDGARTLAQTLGNSSVPAVLDSAPAPHAVDVPVGQRLQVQFSKRMDVSTLNSATVTLIGPDGNTPIRPVAVEGGVLMFVTPERELVPGGAYTLFVSGAADEQGRPLPFTAIGFSTATLGSSSGGSAAPGSGGGASSGGAAGTASSGAGGGTGTSGTTGGSVTPSSGSSLSGLIGGVLAPYTGTASDGAASPSPLDDSELWYPGAGNYRGDWTSGRRHWAQGFPPARAAVDRAIYGDPAIARLKLTPATVAAGALAKYQAASRKRDTASGVTAVAGQVMKLNGRPLAGVTLTLGALSTRTDANGEFLLSKIPSGHQILIIDGGSAGSSGRQYGRYEYGMDVEAGKLNALPFVIWMVRLDTPNAINIPSPTAAPVTLTNPRIPGLELRIPAGTVIRDASGKIVTQLSMTAIPTDQPPFPLPNLPVPTYFTIQPGGAHLESANGQAFPGAQLIYPNFSKAAPGTRIDFWNYDALSKGWYVYGQGTVSANGLQIVPDPGVVIYEFSGAMVANPTIAPGLGPTPCPVDCTGDPVDPSTGLFTNSETDLTIPDVIPINLTRTYRQLDSVSRGFGVGTNLGYDFFIVGTIFPYTYQDLILPDGAHIHYPRISTGTSWTDAVYTNTSTPGRFYGSVIRYTADSTCYWTLTLKDGTSYCFAEEAGSLSARAAAVRRIIDPRGNVLTLNRDGYGNLTQITSPNGRHLSLSYDGSNRVTQAQDDMGRTVKYAYNAPNCAGCLWTVTDPAGNVETYGYDSNGNMLTVTDKRGNVKVQNQYDANSRVNLQTYSPGSADQATASWNYTLDANGNVTQTAYTDERGAVEQLVFNASGYPNSVVFASGTAVQESLSYSVDPVSNQVDSVTDALGRVTTYSYDALGNTTSTTRLSGTSGAVTTTVQYDQTYSHPTLITDALNNQYQLGYDSAGNLVQATDPLNHSVQFGHDSQGRLISVTDANGNTTSFSWYGADLAAVTDALGRTTYMGRDVEGRLVGITNALGAQTTIAYDVLNRLSSIVDPDGAMLQYGWDQNGNLLSHTDANNNQTTFSYDTRNRVRSKTDALKQLESYGYEPGGALNQRIDRKSQKTTSTYDALGRPTLVTMNDNSTVTPTFDAGDRLTQVVDTVGGSITRTYDGLDNLLSETTPQGSVSYTYDALSRRKTMTVQGQPTLSYGWDNAGRLTGISQGSTVLASFSYDAGNRRTQTTLPNGMQVQYAYDGASQLKQITYLNSAGTVVGTLSYTYDAAGRRISTGGTSANVSLPTAVSGATYDANNRLTSWNGQGYSYDANGNLLSDSVKTYSWNARDQLTAVTGASFAYDAFGRRAGKAVGGSSTNFLYDGLNVVQEQSGGAVVANDLSAGLDELLARTAAGTTTSMLPDGLGSINAETDASQATTATYAYDPYGNTTVASGSSTSSQQYTGRENDGTGLYYLRARYYSPATARFISEDSFDWSGGQANNYAYAGGSPVTLKDPSGHCIEDLCIGETILVVEAVEEIATAVEAAEAAEAAAAAAEEATAAGEEAAAAEEDAAEEQSMEQRYKDAEDQYPGKKGRCELHHITPKYLGGPVTGPLSRIPAAYHQLITNAFRNLWPYASGLPSEEELANIMQQVYTQYPLP